MATTETIIGQTKDGRLIVHFENAGPASYAAGGPTITISSLRAVEKVVSISNDKGYLTTPGNVVISGNTVKVPIYYHYFQCPVTCPSGAREVNAGVNLSGVTLSGIVIGF
jgi:hypothetical protein